MKDTGSLGSFKILDGDFLLNGEKLNIYSGAMHYFRVLPEYWEDRLKKLKAAGLNTVETYVCWNLHEPRKGCYNFSGMLDIVRFIETAAKIGLYVIVRPGPYICAEWDFGGFPAWLLADENIRVRCFDRNYLRHVSDYFKVLLKKLVPLQITHGGNIIAMQVENEYGSYANDKDYLVYIKALLTECGIDVMLFTADGQSRHMLSGGTLLDVYKALNFSEAPNEAFPNLEPFQSDKPKMCGEYWCGWFDHWGEKHHTTSPESLRTALRQFFEQDASFNLYMFHGGTNFNFYAGANYHDTYSPTVTSYDYDAPLSEHGGYTEKYHIIRQELHKQQGIELGELPPDTKLQKIGRVELTTSVSLLDNFKILSKRCRDGSPHYMEHYGQSFGYILYHTDIIGDYPESDITIEGIHDIAYIYADGKFIGKFDRSEKPKKGAKAESFTFRLPAFNEKCSIDILVEGMGRVNFGRKIYDRKGISAMTIDYQLVFGWDVYPLPLDNIENIMFLGNTDEYPCFLRGSFKADLRDDCYIDMRNFKKGCVWINGFNLGRYWEKGPQRSLYLPGALLKSVNTITVFEQECCKKREVRIVDRPILK
ncbi:MAG: Beta-galactosidase precursor [Firmicutes bacterium ADurb.Bin300]|jgi:beta-galactosidase|nr:MAG: Beta-galactosidase precursor [Firmicutes bacterium ADurb.Bin300]HOD02444.1 beta-galactosidase [Clostridiales bacterium]